jgi:hypothetical protein
MNTATPESELAELGCITVSNDGPHVIATNYFDTPQAQQGFLYASWNAGALRLLLPDNQTHALAEMRSARNVVVTKGHHAAAGRELFEILFDDDTDEPFMVLLDPNNSDRQVGRESHGKPLSVHVYTRTGCAGSWRGQFRLAPLPCLKPIGWLPNTGSKKRELKTRRRK